MPKNTFSPHTLVRKIAQQMHCETPDSAEIDYIIWECTGWPYFWPDPTLSAKANFTNQVTDFYKKRIRFLNKKYANNLVIRSVHKQNKGIRLTLNTGEALKIKFDEARILRRTLNAMLGSNLISREGVKYTYKTKRC